MTARENGLRCGKSLQYSLKAMGGGDQDYGERPFAMFGQETMNICPCPRAFIRFYNFSPRIIIIFYFNHHPRICLV